MTVPNDTLRDGQRTEVTVAAPVDLQKRLIYFVREYLNRGFRVRDAVSAGFKAVADSYGETANVRVTEESFEKMVTYFEQAVEKYRTEQGKGSAAVGGGLYAEVVSDDEFHERTRSGGD
jgi:hypothetical protein